MTNAGQDKYLSNLGDCGHFPNAKGKEKSLTCFRLWYAKLPNRRTESIESFSANPLSPLSISQICFISDSNPREGGYVGY